MQLNKGFLGGAVVKIPPANARDKGSLGLARFPREGNGNPFQYSCLRNSMDTEAWWATDHGVAKSHTQLCTCMQLNSTGIYFNKVYLCRKSQIL